MDREHAAGRRRRPSDPGRADVPLRQPAGSVEASKTAALIEGDRREPRGVVARHRQARQDRTADRDRLLADHRPTEPVDRHRRGDRRCRLVPACTKRGAAPATPLLGARAAGRRPPLERDSLRRRDEQRRVRGVSGQALTDHDAGLRPRGDILYRRRPARRSSRPRAAGCRRSGTHPTCPRCRRPRRRS